MLLAVCCFSCDSVFAEVNLGPVSSTASETVAYTVIPVVHLRFRAGRSSATSFKTFSENDAKESDVFMGSSAARDSTISDICGEI